MENSKLDVMRDEKGNVLKCESCPYCKKTGHLGAVWNYCDLLYKENVKYAEENNVYPYLASSANFRVKKSGTCIL